MNSTNSLRHSMSITAIGMLLFSANTFSHSEHGQDSSSANLETPNRVLEIFLHGAVNAMHEICEIIEPGGLVSFSFHSEFPVEFDVHHHTENDTFYPFKASQVTRFSDQFLAVGGTEYCFNFVNMQLRDEEWSFDVTFDVTPVTEASR